MPSHQPHAEADPVEENPEAAHGTPEQAPKPVADEYATDKYPVQQAVSVEAQGRVDRKNEKSEDAAAEKPEVPMDAYVTGKYPIQQADSVKAETQVGGAQEKSNSEPVQKSKGPRDAYATDEYTVHPTISVKEWIRFQGNSTQRECVEFLTNLARSLHFAHQSGVIHGEIPSDRVQIWPDGRVLVHEMGLGFQIPDDISKKNANRGMPDSPIYSSPEQLLGQR